MSLEHTFYDRMLTMVGGVDATKCARSSTRLLLLIILWVREIRDAAARAHDDTVDLAVCLPLSHGGDGDATFYPSNQGVLLCACPIQFCCVLTDQSVDHAMCWPPSPGGAVDATKHAANQGVLLCASDPIQFCCVLTGHSVESSPQSPGGDGDVTFYPSDQGVILLCAVNPTQSC